jgi:hypothetical protein
MEKGIEREKISRKRKEGKGKKESGISKCV